MAEPRDPQALLAAYRDGLGPSPAAQARMLARLGAELGAASVATSLATPASASAATPAAATVTATTAGATGLAGAAKLAVLVTVLGAATGTTALLVRGTPGTEAGSELPDATSSAAATGDPVPIAEPRPDARGEVSPATPAGAGQGGSVPAEPSPEPLPPVSVARSEREPSEPQPRRRRGAPSSASTEQAEPPVAELGLADEAKALREVDAALRRSDLVGARAALDAHARAYPKPALAAEAELLTLLLGCAEADASARQRADDLLVEHPEHPARARIEARCGE